MLHGDALLFDDREAVAERIRDAFHDRADEMAAGVHQREADERAAGERIGVRRAFAGEVRQEEQAFGAGRRDGGFFGEDIVDVDLAFLGVGGERFAELRCGTIAANRRRRA